MTSIPSRLRRVRVLLPALVLAALTASLLPGVASQPASAAAKPPFSITLNANRTTTPVGGTVTVGGYVRPAKRGLAVILQKRGQGKTEWVLDERGTMSATGRYSFSVKPSTVGLRYYRVVVPASATRRTTASRAAAVTVYRWRNLNTVPTRSTRGTYADSAVDINGVTYNRAFRGQSYYQEGLVDWNLGRDCTRLRGRVGNSDESDALAQANITLTTDGNSVYQRSFGLTQSAVVNVNIAGAFRLAFTWSSTNPDGTVEDQSGASAVLVEAQVYCSN